MPQRQNMSILVGSEDLQRPERSNDNKFSLINSGTVALCNVLDAKISRGQSPPKITSFHLLTRKRWLSVICWIRRSPGVRALQRKQVFTYYLGSDDSLHCKPQAIASGGGAAEAARRQQAMPATAAFGRRPQANAKRRAAPASPSCRDKPLN